MVIGIVGESCTGKSTLAKLLKDRLGAEVVTGKDYLRLARNEAIARKLFQKKLETALSEGHMIYVVSEEEHLKLLPEGAVRVLMTADLDLILERFMVRMRGNLPVPVRQMLEKKHGCFDQVPCAFHIHNNQDSEAVCGKILEVLE